MTIRLTAYWLHLYKNLYCWNHNSNITIGTKLKPTTNKSKIKKRRKTNLPCKNVPGDTDESNQTVIMEMNMETLGRAIIVWSHIRPCPHAFCYSQAIITVLHLEDICLGQKTYSEIQICTPSRRKILTFDHLYLHVHFYSTCNLLDVK